MSGSLSDETASPPSASAAAGAAAVCALAFSSCAARRCSAACCLSCSTRARHSLHSTARQRTWAMQLARAATTAAAHRCSCSRRSCLSAASSSCMGARAVPRNVTASCRGRLHANTRRSSAHQLLKLTLLRVLQVRDDGLVKLLQRRAGCASRRERERSVSILNRGGEMFTLVGARTLHLALPTSRHALSHQRPGRRRSQPAACRPHVHALRAARPAKVAAAAPLYLRPEPLRTTPEHAAQALADWRAAAAAVAAAAVVALPPPPLLL